MRRKPAHLSGNIALWILLYLSAFSAHAQNSSTEGTDFYVTFTSNVGRTGTIVALQVRYVVSQTCNITAQYGDGTYLDQNVQYMPGVYTRDVDQAKCYITSTSTNASNMMLHITSTQNIGVYALNMSQATTDATTVLPVATWGNDYTLISNAGSMPYITVIAPTAGTTFTIRNSAGTAVVSNYAVNTANPVYAYVATADVTGYTVESNHNVAVFSSLYCGNQVSAGACDHNYEQLLPTNTAGRNFFLWNLSDAYTYHGMTPNTQDQIVILALEDNTTVTKKVGATTTSFTLNRHATNVFKLDTAVHINNSTAPVMLTSDQPIVVNHLLGFAPTIKWWTSVEQRVTQAVISPFIAAGNSVINRHQLHVMIPAGSEANMLVRETRNGVAQDITLTYYTNTTNPAYVVATREYGVADNVLIQLVNPAGFIAYMTGLGSDESYIYSSGSGAFNLQAYFTIGTKTLPYNDTHYSGTEEETHTFVPNDNITVKRTLEKPFTNVSWLVNGTAYTITENLNISNTLTFPASALTCGENTLSMSVRYSGASVDSVYTGSVWYNNEIDTASINVSGSTSICTGTSATLTASATGLTSPVYRWYASQTATTPLATGATYTTPALSAVTTYYVSASGTGVCENKPGKRKEVKVTVAPCYVPVNPHLRVRTN